MLKAVNQWCFVANTPLEQIFEVSRDAGYDAVELNVYEPGGVGLTLDSTPEEAAEIARMAKSYGLQLRSLSTGLMWKSPLSSEDADVRAQGRAVIIKMMQLAQAMEIDSILVVPGVVNTGTSYDVCYERSQKELKVLAADAEKYGVRLGIENVWNKFLLSPLEMARYIDEIDSPYVGAYFDVGNVLLYGFPEQWIRILGHRIFRVHVKDFRTAVGNGNGFVSLLEGNVNWHEVRKALQEIGYTDTIVAELGQYAADPLQCIYDTSRHMDVILGGKAR